MNFASEIVSVGMCVPPGVVTNNDLSKFMETTDEWITQRSGIKERRWVTPEVTTSDLALKATEEAIEKAGIKKEEIELIIFATLSPDHDFPGTGVFLQEKLGLAGCASLDIRQACSGFLYGLSIADQFIKTGMYKTVLLVGAEIHSKGMDKTTRGRDVAVLFGDGAGAVILKRTDEKNASRILSTHLHAEGAHAKELWLPAPGMAMGAERMAAFMIEENLHYPKMNGKKVFAHAIRRMAEVIHEGLVKNNMKLEEIDLFLFHQANLRINEMVAQELKIPAEKVFNTIQKYGNTTAATIPIGMYEAQKAGVLKKGMTVASAAFGSGFTWASSIYKW
ncbi:MAG: ketoacyl-ACP synthase III [Bacteriovoracaceae bacterium]|nr:ketoacyl-ACP synthase III [Bacteriovoracaceae bacterium]